MEPLQITARLRGAVAMPNGPIALDGLLAYAVVMRSGLRPALRPEECVPVEIPVEREPGGRFHLATVCFGDVEQHEHRWINRRFPIPEAQALGDAKLRRVNISVGACKSYRIPMATQYFAGDRLTWWCVGDRDEVRALLVECIGYVGKKRGVGLGRVERWEVEPCEPWGDGFPVVRDGQPMRPLPVDWPGLAPDVEQAYRTITYPYHRRHAEELLAVPRWEP